MTVVAASVQADSFLTLHYRLSGPAGDVINTFGGTAATLTLGTGVLAPAVEACLLGLPLGAQRTFELPPGAAFGARNPAMLQWVAVAALRAMADAPASFQVGDVINTFGGPAATLTLGTGVLAPAVEACLLGLPLGAQRTFELPPGAAFGERNPAMLQWVAMSALRAMADAPEFFQVGDAVQFPTPDGQGQFAGVVRRVREDGAAVLFDFNHPLAGQAVVFEVQLIGIL